MKLLGVSSCFFYPDKSRLVFGPKHIAYLEQDMAAYLASPEVMPVLLPKLDEDQMKRHLDQVVGLVMQGGTDVSPQVYGAEPIENNRWPGDPYRDEYELKLLEMALARELPVYGICRGFQLMNVHFGGTLFQDLVTQRPETLQHRDADAYDQRYHEVELSPQGVLTDILGVSQGYVNSVHHQGLNKLANKLVVEAKSVPDGVIEAFSHKDQATRIMGVQWHPEFNHNFKGEQSLLSSEKILKAFLENIK